ncbi:MAG: hypothetical protein EBV28_10300 [Betaproteobacteria bacterium]|nr:hypothetical protein [Betaproteobacteria bacterium]
MRERIRSFILGYAKTDEAEREILKNIYNYAGFRASNNDQLIPIRELELARDRARLVNDDKMGAAEKTKALAEIDARLAALRR